MKTNKFTQSPAVVAIMLLVGSACAQATAIEDAQVKGQWSLPDMPMMIPGKCNDYPMCPPPPRQQPEEA